ncbi:tRNA modification GTPase TrmE [Bartonella henselae]|uniref:tRNA modification GTPase MnmE n=1 Tax=Bartonella henselae TaxID=38323 RepID=X5M6K8_BARHN|nr:tRNA uridine-5-carboxymethylaminomethyl(34) synthesis GTPase MnmE [Bartonella henselae]MDM9996642.1 tRNA uridine-5-carboxymethylaminomethyl(34) synthesis GTPase MnmE [Bartonella henselae]OLL49733.1 tRNA modification GTPase TrmE [Bartonella henselae]OLL50259.1 tRNA modification GTPase TrmE [Bartonella henselae]OLL51578.1 tRNA modification GTPase TrmE [Bartonella henselae]OLL56565.1 tRNA modification GTPase TrmE [Bartonella henselae]
MDTIFAVSSGLLPSGVAVIRLSGSHVVHVVTTLCGCLPKARFMHYGNLTARDGSFLDSALTVFFPAPHSFTGEDCAEFHLHGGKAVVNRFLDELSTFKGCRIAEPGEFSRRAFMEGKLDLVQAEGLADLIEAETESQRRLAVMGTSGRLTTLYRDWRHKLMKIRAFIEAELDFSDEADIPNTVSDKVWKDVENLCISLREHIAEGERASILRDGFKIVIVGAPNSGKSSIMNRLAGKPVAIVTEEAGTTRDALEVRLVLGGLPVFLIDTAGFRETDNKIEQLGIEVAKQHVRDADLVILVYDMQNPKEVYLPETSAEIWRVGNKFDLYEENKEPWLIQFSALTGLNFDHFMKELESFCLRRVSEIGNLFPARKRQLQLLKEAVKEIENSVNYDSLDLSLRAEYLRRASDFLGKITGDIDVEDLLDIIFSEFCIGK